MYFVRNNEEIHFSFKNSEKQQTQDFKFYGLDPCHYFSSGLSWDAMLKMTGVRLERIVDIDMYLFIEKGLR